MPRTRVTAIPLVHGQGGHIEQLGEGRRRKAQAPALRSEALGAVADLPALAFLLRRGRPTGARRPCRAQPRELPLDVLQPALELRDLAAVMRVRLLQLLGFAARLLARDAGEFFFKDRSDVGHVGWAGSPAPLLTWGGFARAGISLSPI